MSIKKKLEMATAKKDSDFIMQTYKEIGAGIFTKQHFFMFQCAAMHGLFDVVKLLAHTDNSQKFIIQEVLYSLAYESNKEESHFKIYEWLLEQGVDIHLKGNLLLRMATQHNERKLVQLLLERGAFVHANNNEALINSVENTNLETVKLLLNKQANPQARNNLCLKLALNSENWEMVSALLEHGAAIKANNHMCLRFCFENGHLMKFNEFLNHYSDEDLVECRVQLNSQFLLGQLSPEMLEALQANELERSLTNLAKTIETKNNNHLEQERITAKCNQALETSNSL
ncbi:MAG: hypothetical protein HAW67_03890 [Endozoicomonadaceae bacterium]|nr:hypothetical protein [Endozoicomonadaceae bacterium]